METVVGLSAFMRGRTKKDLQILGEGERSFLTLTRNLQTLYTLHFFLKLLNLLALELLGSGQNKAWSPLAVSPLI